MDRDTTLYKTGLVNLVSYLTAIEYFPLSELPVCPDGMELDHEALGANWERIREIIIVTIQGESELSLEDFGRIINEALAEDLQELGIEGENAAILQDHLTTKMASCFETVYDNQAKHADKKNKSQARSLKFEYLTGALIPRFFDYFCGVIGEKRLVDQMSFADYKQFAANNNFNIKRISLSELEQYAHREVNSLERPDFLIALKTSFALYTDPEKAVLTQDGVEHFKRLISDEARQQIFWFGFSQINTEVPKVNGKINFIDRDSRVLISGIISCGTTLINMVAKNYKECSKLPDILYLVNVHSVPVSQHLELSEKRIVLETCKDFFRQAYSDAMVDEPRAKKMQSQALEHRIKPRPPGLG